MTDPLGEQYIKTTPVLAKRWWKHGDHPHVQHLPEHVRDRQTINPDQYGWVETLEGGLMIAPGEWILTNVTGEVYICKPDVFAKTYRKLSDD